MVSFQSKWRYLFMFLGVQLVVMALLSREGYQKRVTYFMRIFRKSYGGGRNLSVSTSDVYANLTILARAPASSDVMSYCPQTSPFIRKY